MSPDKSDSIGDNFDALTEAVLDKRPVLREILQKRGDKNLYQYAKDYIDVNLVPPIHARQNEFIGTFCNEVEKHLGQSIADQAAAQLKKYYYISTADHHGPICHPFFLNSNLMASAPYFKYPDPVLKNVIVLACANVSLNNSSFPRGLIFNTYTDGKFDTHRLSFLPSNSHSSAVYNFRAYRTDEVAKIHTVLREMVLAKKITPDHNERIKVIVDEIYGQPEVLGCRTFSEQVTRTNYSLWKKFFGQNNGDPPNLIYIEQETLIARLLIEHHLYTDTAVHQMLFDPTYDQLILTYFDNIYGAFSRQNKTGTYFFWGISKDKNYRVQLWKEGGFLVSNEGEYRIELTPDALQKALENKQIIPSMMLIFTVLCFYYGLKCLGGFNQVNYLTFMKNAYIKMQTDRGNYRSIEVCAHAQTKELCGDLTLAFLGAPDGSLTPASGLDLILYGSTHTWPQLVDLSKHITLQEGLNPMMPEFYRIIYPEVERKPELTSITSAAITKFTGLDKKIKACASIV